MTKKKKIRISLLGVLLLLVLSYMGYAWSLVDTRPEKVWLHRTNSMAKLQEKENRYLGFEVDVYIRPGGVLDVTHDQDTTFQLSIAPYFHYLAQHPTACLWLDIKNLTEENMKVFVAELEHLMGKYRISQEQLVIESSQWILLRSMTLLGYYTTCTIQEPKPSTLSEEELPRALNRIRRIAESGCVKAISFPGYWYPQLRNRFKDIEIDYLAREARYSQFGLMLRPVGRDMLEDPRVKIILIKDKGHFHR